MLTLRSTDPKPVRDAPGRAERTAIWDALERDGRRLLPAHAQGLAEVTGRRPRKLPDETALTPDKDPRIEEGAAEVGLNRRRGSYSSVADSAGKGPFLEQAGRRAVRFQMGGVDHQPVRLAFARRVQRKRG